MLNVTTEEQGKGAEVCPRTRICCDNTQSQQSPHLMLVLNGMQHFMLQDDLISAATSINACLARCGLRLAHSAPDHLISPE